MVAILPTGLSKVPLRTSIVYIYFIPGELRGEYSAWRSGSCMAGMLMRRFWIGFGDRIARWGGWKRAEGTNGGRRVRDGGF